MGKHNSNSNRKSVVETRKQAVAAERIESEVRFDIASTKAGKESPKRKLVTRADADAETSKRQTRCANINDRRWERASAALLKVLRVVCIQKSIKNANKNMTDDQRKLASLWYRDRGGEREKKEETRRMG